MALSLSFLLSSDAAEQRAQREPNAKFVVHAEVVSGMDRDADRFVEIDADDVEHAHTLAAHWVEKFGAISAAVRRKDADGSLHQPCHIAS